MYGDLGILRRIDGRSLRVSRQIREKPFRFRLRGATDFRKVLLRDFLVNARQRRQGIRKPEGRRPVRPPDNDPAASVQWFTMYFLSYLWPR